ncbi:MAG TPA: 6-carboxytetrahydropterin synthase [Caulobacteraceae bacterium]|jgi:6-pyruvoyltetrahydropterin/6-carboxytetrahydropterin synthase|nr:6-carboxytetrahydropterin synthase [Caulobacteraceae bacterium]
MTQLRFEVTKSATFEAAHYLDHGPLESRYRRLHGHSFRVEAAVRGAALGDDGWVADLAELDSALREVTADLDHGLLNERPGLETPTLERLCVYFAERLKPRFAGLSRITVSRPSIGESCALDLTA